MEHWTALSAGRDKWPGKMELVGGKSHHEPSHNYSQKASVRVCGSVYWDMVPLASLTGSQHRQAKLPDPLLLSRTRFIPICLMTEGNLQGITECDMCWHKIKKNYVENKLVTGLL